ncbi:IS21 family transposase [Pseudomarimonas arenosa]|uniref:IS21 family transposase n=1 Tax=Pseudomarimonas arenosa TaxID=2774145 RepID=A0AAW3ZDQ1_9GAMM|nr:IS21 family transposase [Pseudomarimonas arenosa]MBD8524368.1 IS21 family transposase [Pseudomarimonas arenosa]
MLVQEDAVEIEVLLKQGMGVREVARRCGVSRNTVRRVRDEGSRRRYRRAERASKLDPFQDYVRDRLAAAAPAWIPATVILREIRELGYRGSHSILRAFMASLRPVKPPEPVVRFETAPGQQMQIDWAEFRFDGLRWFAFVVVLGYSRWIFGRFVDDQRFETLRDLHVAAFEAMGGVPREGLYDNMATVVLKRDADGKGRHRFHDGMLTLSREYGFTLRLCKPYRARTKGKVERGIRYVRESFFEPLRAEFRQRGEALTLNIVNARFADWQASIANQRVHGTTGERPADRLLLERAKLLPLPGVQPAPSVREIQSKPAPPPRLSTPLQRPLSSYDHYSRGVQP